MAHSNNNKHFSIPSATMSTHTHTHADIAFALRAKTEKNVQMCIQPIPFHTSPNIEHFFKPIQCGTATVRKGFHPIQND